MNFDRGNTYFCVFREVRPTTCPHLPGDGQARRHWPGERTALWRGYVSAYRLGANGRLALVRFECPLTPQIAPDAVEELLVGDFWIELRERFMGDGIRVPFRNG